MALPTFGVSEERSEESLILSHKERDSSSFHASRRAMRLYEQAGLAEGTSSTGHDNLMADFTVHDKYRPTPFRQENFNARFTHL